MPPNPSDIPITGRYALQGRVVTMNATGTVLDRGTVYIDAGRIATVTPSAAPIPAGFENAPVVKTGGTIYPGLIELHNHLGYDVLPLWQVPDKYTNREQWGASPEYRKLISGPMTVLGRTPGYVEAVIRYVECKCLLGGVTTSQGIALFSNAGITHYYRGVVRNAEESDDLDLPAAASRIADLDAMEGSKFLARLQRSSCILLHLGEGTDQRAREHFLALQLSPMRWAITKALGGIHCVALQPSDLEVLRQNGGAMIWSPLSNLLLYGETAAVRAAKARGVLMGIGSDWSLSGSKNLLGELKVARLVSAALENVFSDGELVAMATRNAAAILKWEKVLGSVEAGKHADLLIVEGKQGDPYAHLLEARETDISLVVIGGVPRYGHPRLMKPFGTGTETWRVGGKVRMLNLAQPTADPVVGALKLGEARDRVQDGMQRLPELARNLENSNVGALKLEAAAPQWFLVLDHDEPAGVALRPHLPFGLARAPTATMPPVGAHGVGVPLSEILQPMELDPLTVADDAAFLDAIIHEPNLPLYLIAGLSGLY